jgi:hypothetical protein
MFRRLETRCRCRRGGNGFLQERLREETEMFPGRLMGVILAPRFGAERGPVRAGATPGKTGGISSVKATRIAAVFAGDASTLATALTSANAVFSLAAVTASAIGADVAGNGFSDTERGSNTDFDLGTDWAVDGVVIARAAGLTAPSATPLKVLTV